ncbi:14002_t:CDS:2 [Funneliformis geosporum]|uniref:14002_t:CDS:1 n=1 Tax=Funneliformis geosporum TaxID=1117311 RepID=A0A9W4SFJ8_9GLOM|nr:14002_t:CDS:2 [Funneliformis geosporum]
MVKSTDKENKENDELIGDDEFREEDYNNWDIGMILILRMFE